VGADCIREIGISIADPRIALTKGSHPAEQAFAFNAYLSRLGEMHLFPPKAVFGNVLNVLWERIVSAKSVFSIADPRIALTKGFHTAEQAFAFNVLHERRPRRDSSPYKIVPPLPLSALSHFR
jgi:hypothetical protein